MDVSNERIFGQRFKYVKTHIYNMGNMTLSMPEDVLKKMKDFPEIRWSEVARSAIVEKIDKLTLVEKLGKKSKLTKIEVSELNSLIKKKTSKEFINNLWKVAEKGEFRSYAEYRKEKNFSK